MLLIKIIDSVYGCADIYRYQSLMPVPPHNNFKLRSHDFNNILLDQNQQYLSRRSVDIYDLIHRDHAALIFAYQYEYPLRDPFSRTFFLEV